MAKRKTKTQRFRGIAKFEDVGLDAYRKSLLQVAVDVEREVLKLSANMTIKNGRFVGDTRSIRRLSNAHKAIEQALLDAGYLEDSRKILNVPKRVRTALQAEYTRGARTAVSLRRPAVEALKVMDSAAFTNFANIGTAGSEAMRSQLVSAVVNGRRVVDYQATLKEYLLGPKGIGLKDAAGHGMFRHANTLANTAVGQLRRTMDADLAESAGVTKFRYFGPLDDKTRPFCKRIKRQADDGKLWTKAQIAQLDNSPSGPGRGSVFITGGGWNCRHVWEPIFQIELDDEGNLLDEAA